MYILKVDPPLPQHLVLSLGRGSVGSKGLLIVLPPFCLMYNTSTITSPLLTNISYISPLHAVMQSHHDNIAV